LTTINNCTRLSINGKNSLRKEALTTANGLKINLFLNLEYLIEFSHFLLRKIKRILDLETVFHVIYLPKVLSKTFVVNQMALLMTGSAGKEIVVKQLCISMAM
jgi:hypothetical protein